MKNYILLIIGLSLLFTSCYKGPEDLPKFKKRFKAQIEHFEKQKVKTDEKMEEGVKELTSFEKALANAQNADKEFKRVYNQWNKVDADVKQLNREYEGLKKDAENLFDAMEKQTASLADQNTRNELMRALNKTRTDYGRTLTKTSIAVDKLRLLHTEALEIIKALEVAIALGEISNINNSLANIESRVASIMDDLNVTIAESKELYEKKIGVF